MITKFVLCWLLISVSFECFGDYFEPTLNLVIEWDEPKHYINNKILRDKDINRQSDIINHLQCGFIRIKEREFDEQLTIQKINEYIKNKSN